MLLAKLQAKVPSVPTPSLAVWRSAEPPGAFARLRQHPPVTDSDELQRVLALPRRAQLDTDGSLRAQGLIQLMDERLSRRNETCKCASLGRDCFKSLLAVQAWSLFEAPLVSGMLGAIGAGSGKTGLDILMPMVFPNCKLAVLLIPPNLKQQLWDDYHLWKEHFKVPSLVMEERGNIIPGRPVLHVVPYSRLSQPDSTDMIAKLNPDLILADECHRLKDRQAAGASRVFAYGMENPSTRFCFWSGTITDHSINDYAHLAAFAFREHSPLPVDPAVVEEWAMAIDPSNICSPAGALRKLCLQGETLYSGVHRRLVETRGFVATKEGAIGASLNLNERKVKVPAAITKLLRDLRASWQRPDGMDLAQATDVAANARHLASGFWYRWIYPREARGPDGKILPEGVARIDRWFAARKAWNKELRLKLLRAETYLDSPKNCADAAQRALDGYQGELPVWESETWELWSQIKDTVYHEKEAVWVDDYLARDAAKWAKENRGPVWYEYDALGRKIAELSGLPLFGADSEIALKAEKGDRSIIVSIKAHGTGRDGLQRIFNNQLVANPPSSGRTFEQLFARLHRIGQKADEVFADVYRMTPEYADAIDAAVRKAQYVNGTLGADQKLLTCTCSFSLGID
jgi:hypothetical protein